jgi:hypothetical protein
MRRKNICKMYLNTLRTTRYFHGAWGDFSKVSVEWPEAVISSSARISVAVESTERVSMPEKELTGFSIFFDMQAGREGMWLAGVGGRYKEKREQPGRS